MGYADLVRKIQALPEDKRAEVFDFVDFLASRFPAPLAAPEQAEWTEADFAAFSMEQALRDMDDDPVTYTLDDLQERWR